MFSLPFKSAPLALTVVLVCLAGSALASKLPNVEVTGLPAAPSPEQFGTGICSTSGISVQASRDFPEESPTFNGDVNSFIEAKPVEQRVTRVLRSAFDLTNNNQQVVEKLSRGDFVDEIPECPSFGCIFPIISDGDGDTSFASRFRGYLNVTPDMVGKPLHFGFYTDDAVSFVIFDRNNAQYPVIDLARQAGSPQWRTTNTVTFHHSGLYPVEILYVQVVEHAALEMSTYDGTFTDFERRANLPPVVPLKDAGFQLVPPEKFFQTETGRPSFPDINQCKQCSRQFANAPGNGDCGLNSGFYCNGAALCAPCDTSRVCGPSCSPCGASTPNCINVNGTYTCVECTTDNQCPNGRCDPATNTCKGCNDDADCPQTGRCDTVTNTCQGCNDDADCPADQVCDIPNATCVECNRDEDCPPDEVCAPELKECRECNQDSECERGKSCSDHQCVTCSTDDSCAGNSCNCCPSGTQCAAPTPGASPTCVECTTDSQCTDGKKCDTINGRCVDTVPECNTADRCGPDCLKCPTERPVCLDGQVCVACRNDLECGSGQFCLSGECATCTTDRHCGLRCEACDKATPFCLTDGTTAGSTCVACRNDSDCGGGQCDPTTFTCLDTTGCEENCAEQNKVCNGSACVECFADAHCPCGGTCDVSVGVCTTSCEDSGDCLGVEYCSPLTQECERGRRKPGTSPQGGSFCCEAHPADLTSTGTGAFLAMVLVGFLLLYSRRAL